MEETRCQKLSISVSRLGDLASVQAATQRDSPMTEFARMLERVDAAARLPWKVRQHLLRHPCGFKLVNK